MNKEKSDKEVITIFKELLKDYCSPTLHSSSPYKANNSDSDIEFPVVRIDLDAEKKIIKNFLRKSCDCDRNCQKLFTLNELLDARTKFRNMSTNEKNCFILSQLVCFSRHSVFSHSARTIQSRKRQKFEYTINSDRSVCKYVYLFYYGETMQRLKRLQKKFLTNGIEAPIHGNKGSKPVHACSKSEREAVKSFIINFSEAQGLPDPGRDVRKGKGRLRVFLPSVMTYLSIHKIYQESHIGGDGCAAVGYRTFVRIWQEEFPNIQFNNPKSDLCMLCEDLKKQLNQVAAILDDEKEEKQAKIYREALQHLNHVKNERLYYRAHAKQANKNYNELIVSRDPKSPVEANSVDTMMHYSWDFAQQFHYPFEDQQVGPIYFKTPRRAQLFGVCCEGIPRQINYLIDEADFLEKNANTVISLLDHFFENYGFGEKMMYLTADNCVGQNKNNALMQYLMYRVLTGLHNNIEMSFLVVGHTKFSPDGYFGLIRQRYRRSKVYTYEQLVNVIEESSPNKHNICQTYSRNNRPNVIYRDWTNWLSQYFKIIPGITSYHHFEINHKERGIIKLKEKLDSKETKINLIRDEGFPYNKRVKPRDLPGRLIPEGLSVERQWYLYDKIRMHIPDSRDKDRTCPKPKGKR
jgi:hypothetical protein